jgi:geranylgeranyl diphosphate synthase, type I
MTASRSAQEVLAWGREMTDPALREAVGTLPPAVRRVAGFHFGWSHEDGSPAAGSHGKAFRPTLALLMGQSAGGTIESALPAAVAVELVHNFSLLHDDVMDGDLTRRHRPTAWSVFGVGPAILAGDALLALAYDTLASAGGPRVAEGVRMLSATVQELVDGQSEDLAFEARDDVSLEECMSMARAKTGSLLGCSCALGELLTTGDEDRVGHARAFGERLGMSFQLVDDILGIWGDPAVTGKAIHSDIHSRKKSLPVVAALTSGAPAASELGALYGGDEPLTREDAVSAAALVASCGGRAWSESEASRQLSAALGDLRCLGEGRPAAVELEALARLVTTRDR